jgi:rod shape determining protein RodA
VVRERRVTALSLGERLKRANPLLAGLALLLTAVGIATVSTASHGFRTDFTWAQARWGVVGAAAALLVLAVPYPRIVAARLVLYAAAVAGLLLVLAVGRGKSAGRWIDLGGFSLQPSEVAKPVLVVALAGWLRYERSHRTLRGLAVPFALTLVPVLLVMRQPDLGTALLLVPLLFAMLYAAGARVRHLALVAAAGVLALVAMYAVPGLLQPYQRSRIDTFLGRHAGARADASIERASRHQLEQGLMAVASAGWTGVSEEAGGVDDAVASLPERPTDFVFPVFVASWGLLGVTGLFAVYFLFLAAILSTLSRVREPSGRLIVIGVFTLFAVQVLVNLAMTVGLLPVVGVTLPFLSYGGSSLLASFAALGLVLNVGADPPLEFGRLDDDE